jgi:ribosomal protein L11 methyltransferase
VRPGVHEIVIDPGQAFGTGTHPTTRLCLELMLELEPSGSLVDLGCGSGVLAIAARKLGFDPVTALDSDRAAVAATLANARDNAVTLDRVDRVDLRNEPPPRADVVVANLMRPLLLRLSERVEADLVIASGLLDHEADELVGAFGMREDARVSDRGWTALLLRGP